MKKLLRPLAAGIALLAIGTLLAQGAGIAWLAASGRLTPAARTQLLAVVYGIDLTAMQARHAEERRQSDQPLPAFDDVVRVRATSSLDLTLREEAISKALADLRNLQAQLFEQQRRFEQRKETFEAELARLQQVAQDEAINEVRRTLEAIPPKQAKEQVLKMLERTEDKAMNDVVTIVKGMQLDKRKKILSEFKDPAEIEKLHEILREIRLGAPETELIDETRNALGGDQPTALRP